MRRHRSPGIALLLLGALLLTFTFAPGPAAPRAVLAAGPVCSVGAAGATYSTIQAAIADTGCATINLAAGTYAEHLTVQRDVIIQAASAANTILDGGATGVAIDVPNANKNVTLANLTVRHSQGQSGDATGIRNNGILTLNNVVVADNHGDYTGNTSGINNTGTLAVVNSQIANNSIQSASFAAAIFNNGGTLTITDSRISQNQRSAVDNQGGIVTISGSTIDANPGGGIGNTSLYKSDNGVTFTPSIGRITITNSTISGNQGGISNSSSAIELTSAITLTNVTIANNSSQSDGASVYNYGTNVVKLKNTIIAGGSTGANCNAALTSLGNNIEDTNTCGLNGTGDHPNTNPQLSPLRDNGGSWPTNALLPGSPAIDAGTPSGCPATDERGIVRPKDGDGNGSAICDVGAYEYQFDPLIGSMTPASATAGGPAFQLTLTGANFLAGSSILFNSHTYATTFVSSTSLKAQIPAADIAQAGIANVRVVGPDSKRSNLAQFTINNPTPLITGVAPNFISPSGPPVTFTITGAHFVPTSVVRVGGFTDLPTTFINTSQLRAQFDPQPYSQTSKIDLAVINPAPGGGASNIMTIDIGMSYAGSIGGGVPTVAISETLAYIGEGNQLTILNIANPAAPARLGSFTTRERVQDIDLAGQRAYVTDALDGLLILDVADPAHPQLLGSYDTPGEAYDVQVAGNRVYVADGTAGLQIVDATDPTRPTRIGYYPVSTYDLAVVGTTAYLATGTGPGLVYLDVSDPANLAQISSDYGLFGSTYYGIYVANQRVYTVLGSGGLVITNLTNAQAALGSISGLGKVKDVTVVGNRAYLVNFDGTLHVVDVSNDAHPQLLGSYDTPGASWDVRVVGSRAYVADGPTGLLILDVGNPQSIAKLGSYATWNATKVRIDGSRAYIAGGITGLQILDLSDPAHPNRLGGLATTGIIADVAVAGNRAFLARQGVFNGVAYVGGGVESVDISDLAHPVSLNIFPIESVDRVLIAGGRVYAGASDGLRVLNVSPTGVLSQIGALPSPTSYNDLKIIGTRAYATSPSQSFNAADLIVIDISNPAAPVKIGSTACGDSGSFAYLDVAGNSAYVAGDNRLCVIDISDATHPQFSNGFYIRNSSAQIQGVQVSGSLAYLAESTLNQGVVEIIDLNAPLPQSPGWLSERQLSSHLLGLQLVGKMLYLAAEEGGLQIIKVQPQLFSASAVARTAGGNATNRDSSVVIQFPAGGIPQPLSVTYAGFVAPTQPLGTLHSAGASFRFEARDQNGKLVTQFLKPYTMVISYDDTDLAALGVSEADLNVVFWNGSAWVPLLPCPGCGVDTANNRVTVVLNHFTEFALVTGVNNFGRNIYLPLVRR